ncbi:MAG TPA: two-component regulator propeller domain-containing protein, partial [Candidatus Kapabacteria bacterium]|nr:two-component regulator propeller domain-containing protein [Candidatus Kapabacteria bacterium]
NSSNTPLPGPDGGIIAFDSLDRLWVATGKGLFKYDHVAWTKYDMLNAPLASNTIETVAADRVGNIWVGTAYDYPPPPVDRGFILKFDGISKWEVHNDTLDGIFLYDTTFDTVHQRPKIDTALGYELDPDSPWSMMVDHTGALWIGFDSYINRQIPGRGWDTYMDPEGYQNAVFDLKEDTEGIIWGGDEYGAIRIDTTLHQLAWHRNTKGFPFFGACSIIPIGDSLWTAGSGGGGIAYGKDTTWRVYNKFSDCPFENDQPQDMTIDSKGRYWFGMRPYHMLYMYDGTSWTIYDSLVHGTTGVLALAADSSGSIYVGNGGDGITKFDGQTAALIDLHAVDSFSNVIYSLMWDERRHALWVGNGWEGSTLRHSGVAEFDGEMWHTWRYPDINAQVMTMSLDTADNVWAACYGFAGTYELLAGSNTWQYSTALSSKFTFALTGDSKGSVWAATSDLGPAHWDGSSWQTFTSPNIVSGVDAGAIDTHGRVWIGGFDYTGGGGASVFDGTSWRAFRESNSKIGSLNVWSAMADAKGNVWFGTNGDGLLEFIPDPQSDVSFLQPIEAGQTVYPNPAHDILNVERLSGKITVVDELGRIRNCARQNDKLNITNLPAGIYYIGDGLSRTKFVKQ